MTKARLPEIKPWHCCSLARGNLSASLSPSVQWLRVPATPEGGYCKHRAHSKPFETLAVMTMYWLCATCQPLCQEEGIQVLLMDTALTLRSSCSSGEVRLRTGNISRIICATPAPQKVPGTCGLMDSSQPTCKGGSFLLHFADGTIQGERGACLGSQKK